VKDQASPTHRTELTATAGAFQGFKPPTSSTTYTPNQFFDVVLPHASRGCLRAVAYLIRKTLGWSDEEGNPQNPEAHVSFREFIDQAGVSRGALRPALDEAIEKRYLDCLQLGMANRAGEQGFSSLFSLKWDMEERYITKPEEFNGFFSGNGNLTHIPNAFFDYVVPNEPLAVVQVVGVIIRHTIGFQSKFGFRRQQVAMSFSEIMRRTGIGSRATVSKAISEAIARNYICKVTEGTFGHDNAAATVYGIRWADQASPSAKVVIEDTFEPKTDNGSKSEPGQRFKNRTREIETVQKVNQGNGSKIEPGNRSESEPGSVQNLNQEAFKNCTNIKTTSLNNLSKQQQTNAVAGKVFPLSLLTQKLMAEGIDGAKASELVERFDPERIQRQLDALPQRRIKASRTGFLIRAIELDIQVPESQNVGNTPEQVLAVHFYAELGGNSDEPVGFASPSDEEAAGTLLKRLPQSHQENPVKAGRDFARFIERQGEKSKFPIRSLPLAIRTYGDEYMSGLQARAKREAKEQMVARKAVHQQRLEPVYQEHLHTIARNLEAKGGEDWKACEDWFMSRRNRRKRMSETLYKRETERWEDDSGRCQIRCLTFSKSISFQV
jgi:hypothetical protein